MLCCILLVFDSKFQFSWRSLVFITLLDGENVLTTHRMVGLVSKAYPKKSDFSLIIS